MFGGLCEGLQIKCLLELSCVSCFCAFVALGSWLVEGTKCVCRQGLLRKELLLTVVGEEIRGRISS